MLERKHPRKPILELAIAEARRYGWAS